jgi:peptidoglycan L-alanyl-D-glutamate endopeptidase CwlK
MAGATRQEEQAYIDLGKHILAKVADLEWGGNWHDFVDRPHYQLNTGETVAAIRQLFERGNALV